MQGSGLHARLAELARSAGSWGKAVDLIPLRLRSNADDRMVATTRNPKAAEAYGQPGTGLGDIYDRTRLVGPGIQANDMVDVGTGNPNGVLGDRHPIRCSFHHKCRDGSQLSHTVPHSRCLYAEFRGQPLRRGLCSGPTR